MKSLFNCTIVAVLTLGIELGCSLSTKVASNSKSYTGVPKIEKLYIYSFLDFREEEIGVKLLREFKSEVARLFTDRNITTEQLWFNDSPIRNTTVITKVQSGATRVPIKETIIANTDQEKLFAPSHILVIFPSSVTVGSGGPVFSVRWTLHEANTYKVVWSIESNSSSTNWWTSDENHKERAKQLANFITVELAKAGAI